MKNKKTTSPQTRTGAYIKQKFFKSFDGTKIGYQVAGSGKTPFLLCNGLGGSMIAWEPLIKKFYKNFKFVTWDYRGLFTSQVPKDHATLTIPHHVRDMQELIKKESLKSAMVAGWSMGTQVALEAYGIMPHFFKGLFLLNGTYGHTFLTAFRTPLSRYILPVVNQIIIQLMPHVQGRLGPLAKNVVTSDQFIKIVVKLGMIDNASQSHIFKKVAADIVQTDLAVYHKILNALDKHDASGVLHKITVPTLIISGLKDILTPVNTAERMAKAIQHAELFVINRASHYSYMEFPDLINQRLERFLTEHGMM